MSIHAKHIEPWQLLSNDVQDLVERRTESDVDSMKVKCWQEEAEHSVLVIRRKIIGLHKHTPETGNTQSSFTYETYAGRTVGFTRISTGGVKYRCTSDSVAIADHITGEAFQFQRWELVTDFAPISGSYYEKAITAPSS